MNKIDDLIKQNCPEGESNNFIADIKCIVEQGRQKVYNSINSIMIETYWLVGRRIVEHEQQGKERAEYGSQLLKLLSSELIPIYGKNYSERNLYYFKRFYLNFKDLDILNTRVQNLSWSHFRHLLRVEDKQAQNWYLNEASKEQWSVRTLNRNISSQYYYRLLQSPDDKKVMAEMHRKTENFQRDKLEFIKNPIVAEFLGLAANTDFTESQLETAILTQIQKFILELGKGYAFVARQQHIATDAGDYFIDLVFYNYILKCFLLIDLKTTQITHQDVGQMDMYVRMYNEIKLTEGDNPTIGLILCSETSSDIAKYSVLSDENQLFAAKYLTYLPTNEQLKNEIERQKQMFLLQNEN